MLQLIIFSIEHLPLTARNLCPIFRTKVLVSVLGRRILFAVRSGRAGGQDGSGAPQPCCSATHCANSKKPQVSTHHFTATSPKANPRTYRKEIFKEVNLAYSLF